MMTLSRRAVIAAVSLTLMAWGAPTWAGSAILTVTVGDVTRNFSVEDIAALPQSLVETATPGTQGIHKFQGPSLADLMAAVGKVDGGAMLEMRALNDYKVMVPVADITTYKPIVALTIDGKQMSVREKGPLWLIYPLTTNPSADVPEIHSRMIWQLRTIVVR